MEEEDQSTQKTRVSIRTQELQIPRNPILEQKGQRSQATEHQGKLKDLYDRIKEGILKRLAQGVTNAVDNLAKRAQKAKEEAMTKARDLAKKAALWGLRNVAQPIEEKLEGPLVWIDASRAQFERWRAERLDTKPRREIAKARSRVLPLSDELTRLMEQEGIDPFHFERIMQGKTEAEVRAVALREEIQRIEKKALVEAEVEASRLKVLAKEARKRSGELFQRATDRKNLKLTFAQGVIEALEGKKQ